MYRKTPRIAHGLFTWRDGRTALEACLRSTAGSVDEVIIADGLIRGVDPAGLPWFSDLSWLEDADYLPECVPISTKEWESLSSACTWLLARARELDCDWLLYIDGDQELHNGEHLRDWLRTYPGDAFPIPRADTTLHPCPWQCVRVSAFARYVAGCFIVEKPDGEQLSLVPTGVVEPMRLERAPWISHHPERRPPGRMQHRLGNLETVLEPPPYVPCLQIPSLLLELPVMESSGGTPGFYCDQCGSRYFGPGVCQHAHPPAELRAVPSDELAPDAAPPAAASVQPAAAPVADAGQGSAPVASEPAAAAPDQPDHLARVKEIAAELSEVVKLAEELAQLASWL